MQALGASRLVSAAGSMVPIHPSRAADPGRRPGRLHHRVPRLRMEHPAAASLPGARCGRSANLSS